MKRTINVLMIVTGLFLLYSNQTQAQDLKIGVGLVFGTGVFEFDDLDNDLGLRFEGLYTINEEFRATADFTYFFPKSEGDVDVSLIGININGNYIFYSEDELMAYGLAGINIGIVTVDTPQQTVPGFGTFGGSDSESEFGLNLGAGIEYALDFANLFSELKFGGLGGDADQLVFAAGVRFAL
ncbi:outer membrane beta-barrel protein [Fodinibius sp.]|uniref:outer membrane beta-barrel protein n=1 Tax=Fodinibius sp. TaxID=1872440 RepID=UPI002ACDC1C1|nr:outer membrane beta-barrel protein [Fodinibius sp.]MDZ7660167.1 outer membrane beta-barrel protein [Fodinibius sp.]